MLEYSKDALSLKLRCCPPNIDFKLDTIPLAHPYVPRICDEQGHFLIWWGTTESDPDLAIPCLQAKNEAQWINCDEEWKIEKGVALIYPYETEVIVAALKVPGYFHLKRDNVAQRSWLRKMWKDILDMFGDRQLICPSGSYSNNLHLIINKERIPREAYHREIMKQFGFRRHGDFWIRPADELQ
jgi:hypothetical protein